MIRSLMMLLVLVFCSLTVRAQVSSPSPTRSSEADGVISGKVVNENGQPLSGAALFVRPISSPSSGRTTATDLEGNFRVGGLEPALYSVFASAPAYTNAPVDPNIPTYYRIGDTVRLEMIRGGVVTGIVTNALGEPVIAVRVRAMMIRDVKGEPRRTPTITGPEQSTDDRGVYRLYGLAPGTYLVSAGGGSQQFQFNPYDSDVPTFAPSATRDNAVEISVRAGEESNVDIRYRGDSGHTISGTAKVSGASGATILLAPVGSSWPGASAFQSPGGRGFMFSGLSDGDYELMAQGVSPAQNLTTPVLSLSEPKRVSVKGASVTGIELVTRPLGSINGRITLEVSKAQECQGKRSPLFAEMVVRVQRNEKDTENSAFGRMFMSAASPDSNGAFAIRNLSPARYQFEPRFYARYWYLQSITMGSTAGAKSQSSTSKIDAAANWTTLKPSDQMTNLTITLAEGAASIRGKLILAEGAPVPAGSVYLVPSDDKTDNVLRFFVTAIDGDAAFALNNLPPGKYWMLTQSPANDQTATLIKLRQPEAATMRTKLRRTGESQKNEIELKPCQNIVDYQLKQ